MPAGTPKRRLSECNLDNGLFGGAKSLLARKDSGSARADSVVVLGVCLVPSLIEELRVVQGLRVVPVFLYRYSMKI